MNLAELSEQMTSNPKIQTAIGGVVTSVSIPLWLQVVQSYAAAIGAVGGAILVLHGLYRLFWPKIAALYHRVRP